MKHTILFLILFAVASRADSLDAKPTDTFRRGKAHLDRDLDRVGAHKERLLSETPGKDRSRWQFGFNNTLVHGQFGIEPSWKY
jgi:hypothetical protein